VDPVSTQTDLVVRIGPGGGGCESLALMPGMLAPMCSPRLLEENPPLARPAHLLDYPLLHTHGYHPWQEWFARHGVGDVDIAHGPIFDDTNLAYSAATAGQGIGLLHTALTVDEIAAGQLVQLFESDPGDEMGYYIVHATADSNDSRVTRFRDWLLAEVDSQHPLSG
jgi:LysR family glycine cleavage system transcriptional activator